MLSSIPSVHLVGSWCVGEEKPVSDSSMRCECHCVVPENIHTPTTEGIGYSKGAGGSKTQEIPTGREVV